MDYYDNFIKFIAHESNNKIKFHTLYQYLSNEIPVSENLDIYDWLFIFIQLYKQLDYFNNKKIDFDIKESQSVYIDDIEVVYFGSGRYFVKIKDMENFDNEKFIYNIYSSNIKIPYIYQLIQCMTTSKRCENISYKDCVNELELIQKEIKGRVKEYYYKDDYVDDFRDWLKFYIPGSEKVYDKYKKLFKSVADLKHGDLLIDYHTKEFKYEAKNVVNDINDLSVDPPKTLLGTTVKMLENIKIEKNSKMLYIGFNNYIAIGKLRKLYGDNIDVFIFPKTTTKLFEFEKTIKKFNTYGIDDTYDIIYIDSVIDFMTRQNQYRMIRNVLGKSSKLLINMSYFDVFDYSYQTKKKLIEFANDIQTHCIDKIYYDDSYMSVYPIYEFVMRDFIERMMKKKKMNVYHRHKNSFDGRILYEIFD